jgi:hypothetical protein
MSEVIVDVVVTRYNEFINWIDYLPSNIRTIYVYNKGYNNFLFNNGYTNDKVVLLNLKNVGKIEHTIAYHIVNNINALPDTLVFLPGSVLMNPEKGKYLGNIVKNIDNVKEKYSGFYSPKFKKVGKKYNYTINNDKNIIKNNRNINNGEIVSSEFTSLKDFKEKIINDIPFKFVSFRSEFIVSRENILNVDIKIFQNILEILSKGENCDSCYYVERIWAHLFKKKKKEKEIRILKNDYQTNENNENN